MTPHFTDAEISCRCGCGMLPKQDFMDKVEALRVLCGFALPVTSGARCPAYNQRVSGTGEDGPHTSGHAIDIAVPGDRAYRVLQLAIACGFTGIGIQQKGASRFIHLDDLDNGPGIPRPRIWSY